MDRALNRCSLMGLVAAGVLAVGLTGCSADSSVTEEQPEVVVEEQLETPEVVEEIVEDEFILEPVTEVNMDYSTFQAITPVSKLDYYERDDIKGIYISGHVAGLSDRMDSLIELADTTELNAFVIDVKDDDGRISYKADIPAVIDVGSATNHIRDIEGLMDKLYAHDIYPIARIVTFKDPYLARNRQEYAIKNNDGSLFVYKKINWLNPYNRECWDYIIDVAKDAAKKGFKEIQFDYIRFEATRTLNGINFGFDSEELTRQDIIYEFVEYAMEELSPYGVEVSADVFGTIITSDFDARTIGQDYVRMSSKLDVICPMVYPSHYGFGFYGAPAGVHSDLYPYSVIKGSMDDSTEKLKEIPQGDHVAEVRPWLQAFTASYLGAGNYMVYGKEAIRDQIEAAYDAGLDEWILWHAGVRYNSNYLLPEE